MIFVPRRRHYCVLNNADCFIFDMGNMYFNTDLPFKCLFDSWNVYSAVTLLATCLSACVLAMVLESTKKIKVFFTEYFHAIPLKRMKSPQVSVINTAAADDADSSTTSSAFEVTDSIQHVRCQKITNHTVQSGLHGVRVLFGQMLMLTVMTYNTYVLAAVVCGSVVGYFLFCSQSTQVKLNGSAAAAVSAPQQPSPKKCCHGSKDEEAATAKQLVDDSTESLLSHEC